LTTVPALDIDHILAPAKITPLSRAIPFDPLHVILVIVVAVIGRLAALVSALLVPTVKALMCNKHSFPIRRNLAITLVGAVE
jgi:hypothetical protein